MTVNETCTRVRADAISVRSQDNSPKSASLQFIIQKMKGNSRAQKKNHRNRVDYKHEVLFVTTVISQAIRPKTAKTAGLTQSVTETPRGM